MNCSACGKANADGVSFCEYCGANMRAQSATTPVTVAPVGAPAASAQPPAPSAADVAQMGKSFFNALSLGEKFIGPGVIAAVIGFFLPWVSTPDLGSLGGLFGALGAGAGASEINHVSYSGVDAAKLSGAVYLILLAAIASGVLLYLSRRVAPRQKLLMGGFQVMIGSLCGPLIIAELLFIPLIQSVAGMGLWLLGLGFCCIAAGGLITIGTFGKTAR